MVDGPHQRFGYVLSAERAESAVLVGHGWINWLIREELLRRGWSANAPYAREYWALNELTRSC